MREHMISLFIHSIRVLRNIPARPVAFSLCMQKADVIARNTLIVVSLLTGLLLFPFQQNWNRILPAILNALHSGFPEAGTGKQRATEYE
jgi:hypothetical protein